MNRYLSVLLAAIVITGVFSCGEDQRRDDDNTSANPSSGKGTYAYDVAFLKKHTAKVLELVSPDSNSRVLLSPDYQGRVMTSAAKGDSGISFGWINYKLISSGEKKKAFNPVGGEERFWLGPEGGQFSLYFKKGDSFNISKWQVPPFIDTTSFEVVNASPSSATFAKTAVLTNYSGTAFDVSVSRTIALLGKKDLEKKLNTSIPEGTGYVAYETTNKLQNLGKDEWTRRSGLVSIWLLAMLTPSEKTTIIIPFSPKKDIKSYITDNYFGEIPPGRLNIKDSMLFFTADGKHRSKIGLSPQIAKSVAGSFDFEKNVLSLIFFPVEKNADYVNSKWELQKTPFKGDVANAYNDGPLEDGTQMGPFYEIESSSPAIALKPSASFEYKQTACHLQGSYEALRSIARKVLGVDLNTLKK
jgi:hypothetical protein